MLCGYVYAWPDWKLVVQFISDHNIRAPCFFFHCHSIPLLDFFIGERAKQARQGCTNLNCCDIIHVWIYMCQSIAWTCIEI